MSYQNHLKPIGITALLSISLGCSVFQSSKKPVDLKLSYDSSAPINYGTSFELKAWLVYSNGKEKLVTGKDELSVTVRGATYGYKGSIYIENYPVQLTNNVISVNASYNREEIHLQDSIQIPFNYKSDVTLSFRGSSGSKGDKGETGSTALLFRDGKEGGAGGSGTNGTAGDNLSVHVWKDSIDFYYIRVTNLTTSRKYWYKIKDSGYGFRFDVTGGYGGQGGDGGDGGPGKDGVANDNKVKEPGDGGAGGTGGTGGNGGNGGGVYIFIHPNAAALQTQFYANVFGGSGGAGGEGGKGGKAGTPLTGQSAASDGSSGISGSSGYSGETGAFQILVEEFDIEYF